MWNNVNRIFDYFAVFGKGWQVETLTFDRGIIEREHTVLPYGFHLIPKKAFLILSAKRYEICTVLAVIVILQTIALSLRQFHFIPLVNEFYYPKRPVM